MQAFEPHFEGKTCLGSDLDETRETTTSKQKDPEPMHVRMYVSPTHYPSTAKPLSRQTLNTNESRLVSGLSNFVPVEPSKMIFVLQTLYTKGGEYLALCWRQLYPYLNYVLSL